MGRYAGVDRFILRGVIRGLKDINHRIFSVEEQVFYTEEDSSCTVTGGV